MFKGFSPNAVEERGLSITSTFLNTPRMEILAFLSKFQTQSTAVTSTIPTLLRDLESNQGLQVMSLT